MRFDKLAAFQIQSIAYKSHYENVPFEIPESWCWCKLSDVCNFESGYAFSSDDYKDKGTPLVRISNIQDGLVSLDNCVYIEGDIDKRFIINNGDLLIAMSGATTGKMGVYQYDCPALLNQRVGNIKVNTSLLLQKYRDYFMQSQGDLILKLSYGGAQPNVSAKIISDLFIPIPSLNEQEKIVAEIEKWFGFIDEIENGKIELESHIKKTKSKILDLAISGKLVPQDPNDEPAIELLKRINPGFKPCDNSHYENLPQGWAVCRLSDMVRIQNGFAFQSAKYIDVGIRIIRITNVQSGYIIDESPKFYPHNLMVGLDEYNLKNGDLLMSLTGNVGRVGIMPENLLPAALNQRVCCIKPKNNDIDKMYLFYYFQTEQFIQDCIASGKGVAQLNVSTEWLKHYIIQLPPKEEQSRIVKTIDALFSIIDKITAEL